MKRVLKWLKYTVIAFLSTITIILAFAYWNRDQLLELITDQLNKGINGKFHIQKVDFTFFHHFPNFSVTLRDVYLRGSKYEMYHKDIFSAKKIFLDIRLYPLLKKEVRVKSLELHDATVFIFRSHDGYSNTDIFNSSEDTVRNDQKDETSMLFTINKIGFQRVNFVYADSVKNKSMSFQFLKTDNVVTTIDSLHDVKISGNMHVDHLTFNPLQGGFLVDKEEVVDLHLSLNTVANTVTVHPSSLVVGNSRIQVTGAFELQKGGKYALSFQSSGIYVDKAKLLLNEKLNRSLQKFTIDKPVDVLVHLRGKSIPGYQPNVDVMFESKNATFHYGTLDFTELSFSGSFSNTVDSTRESNNDNSQIYISAFKGKLETLPISGNVLFTKLVDPVMDLSVTTALDFSDLNNQIDTSRVVLRGGKFTSHITYSGKLSEYIDHNRTYYIGKLTGKVKATKASLHYKPKKIFLDNINLQCTFNEKKFTIEDLDLQLNGSTLRMKGSMQNFIPFFIRPKNKGYIRLKVTSPNLDLTAFASPVRKEKQPRHQVTQNRKKMTDMFDKVYHILEFDLDVKVDQLTFKKFTVKDFTGQVKLDNTTLEAKPVAMKIAGGTMNMAFTLTELFNSISPMVCTGRLSNANIKDLFMCFNNFNQRTIQVHNLSGSISADVNFSSLLDEDYSIVVPSMRGSLDCKIKNGGLTDFEPLQNMSNFLFKKRDFTDVHFAELNSSFSIKGTELDISRMEIQSTVLSLFLQGRYSFTDSTSLSVQIPLSNLKKRNKDFKPENVGNDAKIGPSVFLHIYRNKDINSKVTIAYDPFKKWVKK